MGLFKPKSPNPYKVAAAQGQINDASARLGTKLDHYDQYNPFGSLTWDQGGPDFKEADYNAALDAWRASGNTDASTAPKKEDFGYDQDRYSSTETYDPRILELINSQLETSKGLEEAIRNSLGGVNKLFANSVDLNSLPDRKNPDEVLKDLEGRFTDVSGDLNKAQGNYGNASNLLDSQLGRLEDTYSTPFDYNNTPAMPGSNEAARTAMENAIYGRYTSRLDPQFNISEDKMRAMLAAKGITEGSEAYNREFQNFNFAKNDAYENARRSSVEQGLDAMQRMFGMQMGARQQGVSEENFKRQLATQEALAALGLSSGTGQTLQGMYGVENAQNATLANMFANFMNTYNSSRGNALSEQFGVRDQSLNELNALRTGAMVDKPQFQPGIGGGQQVIPADLMSAVYNSYQGDLAAWQSLMGGATNLGSSGILAYGMMK